MWNCTPSQDRWKVQFSRCTHQGSDYQGICHASWGGDAWIGGMRKADLRVLCENNGQSNYWIIDCFKSSVKYGNKIAQVLWVIGDFLLTATDESDIHSV